MIELALFAAATLITAVLTWFVRRHALLWDILDIPNARSSHTRPTPRGGGVAISVVVLVTAVLSAVLGYLPATDAAALAVGGGLVAAVGYYDDLRGLSARARIAVHVAAAILVVGVLVDLGSGTQPFPELPAAVAFMLFVIGIVWSINLFNFMDGIDGIAGSQAAFVSLASVVLITISPDVASHWMILPAVTAGACAGFLAWNWPPAKIFMGDVGSGFLGFWLAGMALVFELTGAISIWTSTILGSVFIADATVTLLRRVARGERWYEAHRSHAYQSLARRWNSHGRVTGLLWGVNVLAVLPLAAMSAFVPEVAPGISAATLGGLGLLALLAGAGRSERAVLE